MTVFHSSSSTDFSLQNWQVSMLIMNPQKTKADLYSNLLPFCRLPKKTHPVQDASCSSTDLGNASFKHVQEYIELFPMSVASSYKLHWGATLTFKSRGGAKVLPSRDATILGNATTLSKRGFSYTVGVRTLSGGS